MAQRKQQRAAAAARRERLRSKGGSTPGGSKESGQQFETPKENQTIMGGADGDFTKATMGE